MNPMTLEDIQNDIYQQGVVTRGHLLEYLKLQDTSDNAEIARRVRDWLEGLHADPYYSKVRFQYDGVNAILGDLASYGRVMPETIMGNPQAETKIEPIYETETPELPTFMQLDDAGDPPPHVAAAEEATE